MGMTTTTFESPAARLIKWTEYRESDIAHARRLIKLMSFHKRPVERAMMLHAIHSAIDCVRTDIRSIEATIDELSMCPCGLPTSQCVCVAPF